MIGDKDMRGRGKLFANSFPLPRARSPFTSFHRALVNAHQNQTSVFRLLFIDKTVLSTTQLVCNPQRGFLHTFCKSAQKSRKSFDIGLFCTLTEYDFYAKITIGKKDFGFVDYIFLCLFVKSHCSRED